MKSELHSTFKDSTKDLKRVLAQEDCVLFIGSGISMWSGLPSWLGVIEELARFIESTGENADLIKKEAQRGDLLLAASYGFDKLTKTQRSTFIRAVCKCGVAKPHNVHQKIVSLGPRCFITTNYDHLIEESLRNWQPDRFYSPPITNRHLTEMAQIIQARAIDFIYKPHGDAADIDSIIFTREQYQQLLVQGERHAALESLKMLMVSRPIVYLGYGLRDPDFSYLRDILVNTYKGAVRDHYAVMADVSHEEIDYWKKNYGIHLISYPTSEHSKDHSALLGLLDVLLEKEPVPVRKDMFDPYSSDVILAMARYAATLMRTPKMEPEFHIRVHAEEKRRPNYNYFRRFEEYSVEDFLDKGSQRAILIGLPGAGKSYSLHQSTARLAAKLHTDLLSESFIPKDLTVPIFVDLKLYNGNITEMVNRLLPISLPLTSILQHYNVKIYIDSFNEMPKEYRENGSYELDFENFLKNFGSTSIIICSRNNDGLQNLNLPIYNLDEIDESTIEEEFKKKCFAPTGLFEQEIRNLLKKPLYFQYIISDIVKIQNEARPKDFYEALIENISTRYNGRFDNVKIDIKRVLSVVAFNSLEMGIEAFPLNELISVLNNVKVAGSVISEEDTKNIANWLVSTTIIAAYSGGRIAFIHQSITEYLAAVELARRYLDDPNVLIQKLKLNRWDQAIFLTISLLPPDQGESFLRDIVKVDFSLALNAVKYLEDKKTEIEVVNKLLCELPNRIKAYGSIDYSIMSALEFRLPLSEAHEPILRVLLNEGDSLGGSAARRLSEIKGEHIKDELLLLIQNKCDDFNMCNRIGSGLSRLAHKDDIDKIVSMSDSLQDSISDDEGEDQYGGFITGATEFLSKIDISDIWNGFFPEDNISNIPKIKLELICSILSDRYSTTALDYAGRLLLMGYSEATTPIAFMGAINQPSMLPCDSFCEGHINQLVKIIYSNGDNWALEALKYLCLVRQDFCEIVKQHSLRISGISKAALLYCCNNHISQVFSAFESLFNMTEKERREQPYELFNGIDLDWLNKADLYLNLLKMKNEGVASMLLGPVCPPKITNLGILEIEPINWLMEWIFELLNSKNIWLAYQLGGFLALYSGMNTRDMLIAEINNTGSNYRDFILRFVLPYMDDTSDVFNEDTILFIFDALSKEGKDGYMSYSKLLGQKATDIFITERIIPKLKHSESPLTDNLRMILRLAGSRHGKRYIIDDTIF